MRHFVVGLAEALRLPRTARRIVTLLARSSRHLSVKEIVARVRVSERSVRGNLALLLRRGLLDRKAVTTAQRRLAYLYRLRPMDDVLAAVREQFAKNLAALSGSRRRQSQKRRVRA